MSVAMWITRRMVARQTGGFFDQDTIDVVKVRATLAEMLAANAERMKPEPGVTVSVDEVAGVAISTCTPAGAAPGRVVFYVHGGGLVTGDHLFAIPYASQLAAFSGCQVVSCNYRLAPEHPFPAGLDDVHTVYRYLSRDNQVAVIGESGGAYLSFALALRLTAEGTESPACLVVNSIVADMSGEITRHDTKQETTVSVAGMQALGRLYAPGQDLSNPEISVIRGDYTSFPPTRVVYDQDEVLAIDSQKVIDRLQHAGVEVETGVYRGTFHAFTTTGKATPESKRELELSCAFMTRHLAGA